MTTLAVILLVCIASVFALTACNFELGGEETWHYDADKAEGAKELFDGFVSSVLACDDMVVTAKNDDGVYFVQNVKGDKASVDYSYGTKAYAFVKEGKKVAALDDEDRLPYYISDNDEYDYIYKTATSFLVGVDEYLTQEGLTVSLNIDGKKDKDGQNATLSLTINDKEDVTTITVVQKDEKVVSYKSVCTDEEGSSSLELTFAYGTAQVTIPDLTDWFNASEKVASEWYATGTISGQAVEEIALYYDYITGCYNSDYVDIVVGDTVIIKSKNDATVSYPQHVNEDFLAGHECISFDADEQSICFFRDGE